MLVQAPHSKLYYATWIFILTLVAGFSGILGIATVAYYQIFFGDNSNLERSAIVSKINDETTIFYLDGKTRLGSFFDSGHRRYISIDEIPPHLINAVIAAEDKNFYHHNGFDFGAMISAFLDGLKSGRFRGASTITMQTVRNVLESWERTYSRKFREIIASIQIERMYSKREILEFYLNQFHVAANGHGIGVAARYYFDKEIKEIDLVEAAFIAGSVKAPSRYNPFLKYTQEERDRSKERAGDRKNYVLRRMYQQGWITEEEFKDAYGKPVPFKFGKFAYKEVGLVDLIRRQINAPEILQSLNMDNPAEISGAGLRVFTTIDSDMQQAAQLAMRRNLSRLHTILEGFSVLPQEEYKPLRNLEVNEFFAGKVIEILGTEKDFTIRLNFGYPSGVIPHESLMRYAKLLDLPTGKGEKFYLDLLHKGIKIGDVLFVEVKEYDPATNEAVLELHGKPIVNGGLVVLDKGEVRAAVSGFDTIGYNRAIFAKRQAGSVFKSVVYYAALQLGWTPLDQLDNERQLFPYQGRFYFPRPDHPSPYSEVSMLWAGTLSENVASVALTARLVEKLNLEQFKFLMGTMDLLPHDGESAPDFHYRVAKALGVQLDNEGVREYQLRNAVSDITPDLVFSRQSDMVRQLRKIWWGKGYAAELNAIAANRYADISLKERARRILLLKNNYTRMEQLARSLEDDWKVLSQKAAEAGPDAIISETSFKHILSRFKVLPGSGTRPMLGYFKVLDGEALPQKAKDSERLRNYLEPEGRPLNALDVQAIWGGSGLFGGGSSENGPRQVIIGDYLPLGVFYKLRQAVNERYDAIMQVEDPYDLVRYHQHHDFRIALGLNYLVQLCKALGVTQKIEPVLSFPLGTNDVTAGEIAKIFQTFTSGKIYRFYKDGPPNQMNFIRRIEDRFGNVLYEPKQIEQDIVKFEYSVGIKEILRKVITHGTGRRAYGELYITLDNPNQAPSDPKAPANKKDPPVVQIPSFGKTGTTNDYTTAYFAGFVPYPVAKGQALDALNSYVITSYVGYDKNKIMQRGRIRVYGGVGALPLWTDFAKQILERKKYIDYLDTLDLGILSKRAWPLKPDPDTVALMVDLPRGLVIRSADEAEAETFSATDIARTGETYQSEFAIGQVLKSYVHLPRDPYGDGYSPLRMFSPFKPPAMDDTKPAGQEGVSTRISASPAAGTPGGTEESAQNPEESRGTVEASPSPGGQAPSGEKPPIAEDSGAAGSEQPKPPTPKQDLLGPDAGFDEDAFKIPDEEKRKKTETKTQPEEWPLDGEKNGQGDRDIKDKGEETGSVEEDLW